MFLKTCQFKSNSFSKFIFVVSNVVIIGKYIVGQAAVTVSFASIF